MPAKQEISGPKYLDKRKLYRLSEGEEVLYSIHPPDDNPLKPKRKLSAAIIDQDPKVIKLLASAKADAKKIESSPTTIEGIGMASELQGYYRDVRIVPARDVVLGHRIKGWTLIGVPREPHTIVYGKIPEY